MPRRTASSTANAARAAGARRRAGRDLRRGRCSPWASFPGAGLRPASIRASKCKRACSAQALRGVESFSSTQAAAALRKAPLRASGRPARRRAMAGARCRRARRCAQPLCSYGAVTSRIPSHRASNGVPTMTAPSTKASAAPVRRVLCGPGVHQCGAESPGWVMAVRAGVRLPGWRRHGPPAAAGARGPVSLYNIRTEGILQPGEAGRAGLQYLPRDERRRPGRGSRCEAYKPA